MNNELKTFIQAVGALAEVMRLFRDSLIKNGFTRREAIQLTETFMVEQLNKGTQTEEDN